MLVFGITGPSGSGKGIVSAEFSAYGLPVIDADEVYHELLIPPSPCLDEIAERFGFDMLEPTGQLNRKKLAALVFSDSQALSDLNHITHHYVMAEIRRRIDQQRRNGVPALVLDAPQLFEAGANRDCNVIISVLADKKLRLERIIRRDGISPEAALRRIEAQKSDDFFRKHADYVIENNENPERIYPRIRQILTETGVLSP